MKQARSLQEAGHDISIIGVKEAGAESYRSITKEGIYIYRAPVKETASKIYARILFFINASILSILSLIFSSMAFVCWPNNQDPTDLILFIIKLLFIFIILFFIYHKGVKIIKAQTIRKWEKYINLYCRRRAMLIEILPLVKQLSPDLIYCHECIALEACMSAKKDLLVPLVYDAHEFYEDISGDDAKLVSRIFKDIHNRYIRKIDAFVTVGQVALDMYKNAYPEVIKNHMILPNSVEPKYLRKYDGRLHKKAGISLYKKILLYHGGVSKHRKVDQVINASKYLTEDWHVVVMGMGADLPYFKDIAASINNEHSRSEAEKIILDIYEKDFQHAKKENLKNIQSYSNHFIKDREYMRPLISSEIEKYKETIREKMILNRRRKLKEQITEKLIEINSHRSVIGDLIESARSEDWALASRLALEDIIQIQNIDVSKRVSIIDPVPYDDLLDWAQGAHIGIIPYPITNANHWGAAPNKLWEFPAAGVPVLVTPSLEMSSTIQEYGIGWMISADPTGEEIAHKVLSIHESEITLAKEACKKFIIESNWTVHVAPWIALLEKLYGIYREQN
ncbi:MAG: hypothetical protein JKP92_02900 [Alphaproteobacteria bacterium]|jgi:glycosyltransferase involved in cell wall biosynthesis|nr:hypothetical protein [Alphaproteobacteria bacterium]